jgi:hypothetical protein
VKDIVFQAHSHFFTRGSESFRRIFEEHNQSFDDGHVRRVQVSIKDGDIEAVDFERFLSVMYPSCVWLCIDKSLG